jgi:glutathione synthase/RimK-type ligase-like ATP-grasp enzyme
MVILCISYESDLHYQTVLSKCPLALFSASDYPEMQYLSYHFDETSFNTQFTLTLKDGLKLDLSSVSSVYYRRLVNPDKPSNKKGFSAYNNTMATPLVKALEYAMPKAKWLSHPSVIRHAENKLFQLMTAQSIGFTLPPTYIGNCYEQARAFIEKHKTEFIVKATSVHYQPILIKKKFFGHKEISPSFMTKKFSKNDLLTHLPHITNAPAILQTYVPKKTELRITVVGDKIFPCSINAQNSELGKVDWRYYDMDNTLHEAYTLPTDVEQKCFALVKELGLNFGCIDMVVTPDDEHVFLEINPNGQWLWIENLLPELTISQAIADFLTTP